MTAAESERLTPEFAAEFLAHHKKLIEARDVDGMIAMCSEDVVYEDAGPSSQVDRKEMQRLWTPIFGAMEQAKATVLQSFLGVEGDSLATHWQLTFEHRGSNEPLEVETVEVQAFRDGLIYRWTSIFRHSDWMGDLWP